MTAATEGPAGSLALRTIAMPSDTNPAGDIFGGWLMMQMDLAGGTTAMRRAAGRCVTVAVEVAFRSPVFVDDEVSLYTRILSTGRTSMKVGIEVWRRNRYETEASCAAAATFTYVAIDDARKSRALPAFPDHQREAS